MGGTRSGQSSALHGVQIAVGTPGRTLDHLRQGNLSLDRLSMFVLDEADEMLDRGVAPDVERILAYTPAARQTALFSATLPPSVAGMAARHVQNAVTLHVDAESAEWFTHRVGRTGRMGRAGRAITLLTTEDAAKWRQFEKALGQRLERRRWAFRQEAPAAAPAAQPATGRGAVLEEQPPAPRTRNSGRSEQPSGASVNGRRRSVGGRPWLRRSTSAVQGAVA